MISPFYQLSDHTQSVLVVVQSPSHVPLFETPRTDLKYAWPPCPSLSLRLSLGLDKPKGFCPRRKKKRNDYKSSFLLVFSKSMINQNYYSVSLLESSHYGSVILCLLASSSQDKTPANQSSWWNPCSTYKCFSKFPRTLTFSSKTVSQQCIVLWVGSITIPTPDQFLR